MKYTDLIFDLYGTLVDTHTDEGLDTWERTAIYYGFYGAHYTGQELKDAFESQMKARHAEAGESYEVFPDVPCEVTFAQLFRDKGIEQDADKLGFHAAQVFRMISMEYIRLYENVMEALATFRQNGYRLWLLSNAQRVFTAYELRHLGLEEPFDGIYISSDHGCRKPDLRFFQTLLKEQDLDPEKCLMIGNDRRTDIAGAKAAGLDTLYMHTNITPPGQKEADPDLLPGKAPAESHHFEFEGSDWSILAELILNL
jgi:putative hydrolase of the HAD superfamily